MIEAKIITDSVGPNGVRLTTFVLTYPRFIHAEFMTHRVFSRNASSSRAIPVSKQIQMVIDNPAIPLAFTKNKKGMQGGEALVGADEYEAKLAWLDARNRAVEQAQKLADLEVHKQYANRLLEPFAHITVVCTATDFDNFFALRCHPAAQPEIHELADKMYALYSSNKPKELKAGQWHLPFITEDEFVGNVWGFGSDPETVKKFQEEAIMNLVKQSVARCARVSYLNHDGTQTTLEQDLALYNRLLGEVPIHASPAEHQAQASEHITFIPSTLKSNFRGWIQYRKTLANENITEYKP